jgi:hypothetical protein
MRTLAWLLVGLALGAGVALTSLALTGGRYEYELLLNGGPGLCAPMERIDMVQHGWEVVPQQPDACYFRRSRLRWLR